MVLATFGLAVSVAPEIDGTTEKRRAFPHMLLRIDVQKKRRRHRATNCSTDG